jgi:predicted HicB family RNase H-like nuclease
MKQTVTGMKPNGESMPNLLSLQKLSGKFMVRTTPEVHRWLAIQAMAGSVSLNRLVNSTLQEYGRRLHGSHR